MIMALPEQTNGLEKLVRNRCIKEYSDVLALSLASISPLHTYGFCKIVYTRWNYLIGDGIRYHFFQHLEKCGYLKKEESYGTGKIKLFSTTDSGNGFLQLKNK